MLGVIQMNRLSILCLALCIGLPASAALARGGSSGGGMGGMHHSSGGLSVTGGAAGTSPGAPGTNAAGTALSSGGHGNGPQKGPLLGTNAAVDRENARVEKSIKSICRGC
jgi:hypothetical protein